MNTATVELTLQWLGGAFTLVTLAVILYGLWRGTRRQVGRVYGHERRFLYSPWTYLVSYTVFFGLCVLGWIPLPLGLDPGLRAGLAAAGALLFFPGLGLALWGRLALGRNYFVSTGLGAHLFQGHQLVTGGPFALVRHPMYLGILLASFGGLLLYATWTMVFFAGPGAMMLFLRASREEKVLAGEFGDEWQAYCRRVPAFLPRLWKTGTA